MRFWFRFVESNLANVSRGRSDLALGAFELGWASWRGVEVEPVVREAICRLAPSVASIAGTTDVNAWWNRDHSVEVDLVATAGRTFLAVGSIKWRSRSQFNGHELAALSATRSVVPHAESARLIAVCPAGVRDGVKPDAFFDAEDLIRAWTS